MKSTRRDTEEILFCCHASWLTDYGYITVPKDTFVYVYAPLGAALSQTIPRALAAGEEINPGDLTISRISPLTLFNYGYDNTGSHADDFKKRDEEVEQYPIMLFAGSEIPNFKLRPPGEDKLVAGKNSKIIVYNVENKNEDIFLIDLLNDNKGKICHFGGCSWVREDYDKRDLVTFKDKKMEEKYTTKLTDDQKKAKREERFAKK